MFQNILNRPILALSLSLGLVFLGFVMLNLLPVTQLPEIAPPRVNIFIAYPGASARVLVETTLIPLERAINGVPGMQYIISDATSAGEATIQIVFEPDVDPNAAVVNVKTRVDQVMNNLPPLVQREGIIITPIQPSMLMYVNLYSKDPNADEKFLYNYAGIYILPELQRISGLARAQILGSRLYAMRIWLKPDKLRAYNVSVQEVMKALEEQSIIGRPGRLGQASGKQTQSTEYILFYKGRFNKPEEYENVIIRATPEGELLKIKDVATVELGSEFYDIYSNIDGHPAASIVLKQNFGSNAMEVIQNIKAKLEELRKDFPSGMEYEIAYDVSRFVDASQHTVFRTLLEAFLLVTLVVWVFLGDFRATLIPIIAVPISLIGAFIFMKMLGVSLNLITLFALVLAIGIVVDNAIVVVEAVHAKMETDHLPPLQATRKVMGEISGAIISITLIMASVFIPIAFLTGPVGLFYRQFSITMASSIILSGVVALTLTPILCVLILKPIHHHEITKPKGFARLFAIFNHYFEKFIEKYMATLGWLVPRRVFTAGLVITTIILTVQASKLLPSGFIPNDDQGIIYAIIQTPPGTTLEVTNDVSRKLQKIAKKIEGVKSVTSLAGYEILTEGRGSNAGTCLINLKDWSERENTVHDVIEELEKETKNLGAIVEFFEPPAVPGYGSSDGFSLRLLSKKKDIDYQEFDRMNKAFLADLKNDKRLTGVFSFYAANYPQYEVIINNDMAMKRGVSIGNAMENLNILFGSTYEQGFTRFNTFFKVYTQSAPEYRRIPSDVLNLFVKNEAGELVPLSTFTKLEKTQGPNEITRFNLYNSSTIRGRPAAGYTTGDAMQAIQEIAQRTLPNDYTIAWEGLSYDEARRGNQAIYIFLIVLVLVFLILSSQYESFLIPFSVLLTVPVGILGSFLMLYFMGLSNDIYSQIGLIMLVGLLGKNAILIVEFALQQLKQGVPVFEAVLKGAKLRFRPILMTSFAFIVGLIPLLFAKGPSAMGSKTIGSSAFGGMLLGTFIGVLIAPAIAYIFFQWNNKLKIMPKDEHHISDSVSNTKPHEWDTNL